MDADGTELRATGLIVEAERKSVPRPVGGEPQGWWGVVPDEH